nr:hypothetical protein BSM_13900 [uncultured archaeon]
MSKDREKVLELSTKGQVLELGKGFSFVARQRRITVDGDHYYIDLVFYNPNLTSSNRILFSASSMNSYKSFVVPVYFTTSGTTFPFFAPRFNFLFIAQLRNHNITHFSIMHILYISHCANKDPGYRIA